MIRQYHLHDRESIQRAINALKSAWTDIESSEGSLRLVMQIDEPKEPQTDAQRKKCHAWFGEIATATTNTPALVKDGLMQIFFVEEPYDFKTNEGDTVTLYKRKSFMELSKKEVSYLMNSVQAWASQEGIELE